MDVPAILSVTTLCFLSLIASAIIIGLVLQILEVLEMPYDGSRWTFIWGIILLTLIFVILHRSIYPGLYDFWFSPLNVGANWVGSIFGNPQLSCLSLIAIIIGIAFIVGLIWFVWMWFSDNYYETPDWVDNLLERIRPQAIVDEIKPKGKNKPVSMDDDNYVKHKVSLLEDKTGSKIKIEDDGELSEAQPFQITIYGKGDQVSDGFYLEEGAYRVRCKKKGDTGWISVSVISVDDKKRKAIDLQFFNSGSELLDIQKQGRYVFKIQGIFYELQWGIRVEKI
ncbi:MAG: hypothetical protein KJ043_00150 [Anaerolineae bacterium]|nr:hypothetical protein [Anaerolineae bacterium]